MFGLPYNPTQVSMPLLGRLKSGDRLTLINVISRADARVDVCNSGGLAEVLKWLAGVRPITST